MFVPTQPCLICAYKVPYDASKPIGLGQNILDFVKNTQAYLVLWIIEKMKSLTLYNLTTKQGGAASFGRKPFGQKTFRLGTFHCH